VLISQIVPANAYPHVQEFLRGCLDFHFGDVRAMLQLPQPKVGIRTSCNFAIAAMLCNILSGISRTIYMPPDLLGQLHSNRGSQRVFVSLVQEFFPYSPGVNFAAELYEYARNPLAHSAGVLNPTPPIVSVLMGRVLHLNIRTPVGPIMSWLRLKAIRGPPLTSKALSSRASGGN
jgi:hypothetical protein